MTIPLHPMNYTYTPPPRPTPWPWIMWAVISMLLVFGGVQMLDAQAEEQEAYLAQKRAGQKRKHAEELKRIRINNSTTEACRDKYRDKNKEVAWWWEKSTDSAVPVLVCVQLNSLAGSTTPTTTATRSALSHATPTHNPS